ncbi:MAG TPA: MotA/TolQ/ExbB proton channel family protein [Candidatus Krumholzibacteria bacterium]|nr:MotA/TolQ/ExbB proton channel family protein [Candidatus Krumholzibacteria bacterium]HPD70471.1 MotA/TolQ/ExbB proton channel family protein [Candidatus Krumholzibacteria bacterium]HRY39829.1 MotA/TolQ/ExbB proton channel family protein [Candidatus Krumholzibacteria bacterium]
MFTELNWIKTLFESPTMLALIGCSVIALGVAIERWLYFRRRQSNPDAVLLEATSHLREGRVGEALEICRTAAHPVGPVSYEAIVAAHLPTADGDERLQVSLSQQKLLLDRNVGTLGTMAAVAPLIGLLGTVWGIMRAFHDMASTGSAAPSIVASGVAEALITTAAGLVIAIPSVMLFNHFTRRLNVMLTVAENHARSLRAATRAATPASAERPPRTGSRTRTDTVVHEPQPAL